MPDAPRKTPTSTVPGKTSTSIVRTGLAALLAVAGIAWIAVYINVAQDGQSLTWMGDLGRWNFFIGIALVFLALIIASHPSAPLGRGRGVVVGMLGCFLIGLLWIIVYYIAGPDNALPVLRNLDQYNLLVGIAFMGVGFVFATKWE
ncbi:MAG: cell division protein CrgA [Nocardioides sp.]|nr:cell division protein CrgA [Nocardioides sp.]